MKFWGALWRFWIPPQWENRNMPGGFLLQKGGKSWYQRLYLTKVFFWQVIDDDDVVPGWEGKIVAWVEDDSGQKVLSYQEQMAWHRECHREN